ncbi:MAG: phage tail tube protein [Pikeienuella sp.]
MAAAAGRNALFSKGATVLGGVRLSEVTLDAQPIDITDRASDGNTTSLNGENKTQQLSLKVEGVLTDTTLETVALTPGTSKYLTDVTLALNSGLTIGGAFFMTNFTVGMPYDDADTFSCTLTSSGTWTYA